MTMSNPNWMVEENMKSMIDAYRALEVNFLLLSLNEQLNENDRLKYKKESVRYHNLAKVAGGELEGLLWEVHNV